MSDKWQGGEHWAIKALFGLLIGLAFLVLWLINNA